jgi:TetR/AcrR family transcriptional regulator, fatty acid metabolism regulator protein
MAVHSSDARVTDGAAARTPRTATDDRAAKRDRILDAAERVFAQRGFYAAKVADIAREAGVADGTIYLYFKNKDDLLISLFESRMERVNQILATAIATAARPRDQLHAFVRAYLGLIAEQPTAAEVLTIELRQSTKFMREYSAQRFGELLRLLANVIAAGQAAGELSDAVPAPHAARMIFGMLDEMALAWLLGRAPRRRGQKLPAAAAAGKDRGKDAAPASTHFDIARAADWVGALVTTGLERRSQDA